MAPVAVLMERALLEPLRERVDAVGSQLLARLLGEWGLQSELRGLAGAYLLASPAAAAWADGLLAAVEAGGGLEGLDAAELTLGLEVGAACECVCVWGGAWCECRV
ncbi:MAG: hypothetical protein J3K34DRAFT_35867 [Monoraphidium minutum]|nr:MAG: hypothetical protein J3K34DRAFT_35867 [Monoraphidium minutum]